MRIIGYDVAMYTICPGCNAIIEYYASELALPRDTPLGDVFEQGQLKCPGCHKRFNPGPNKYEVETLEPEQIFSRGDFDEPDKSDIMYVCGPSTRLVT